MKQLTKTSSFFILMLILTLTSCVKNEVTDLSLNKSTIAINVGQTDSVISTVTITGDISKQPITWSVGDDKIATITDGVNQDGSNNTSGTSTKTFIVTAVSAGTTTITFQAGKKTATCQIVVNQKNYTFNQALMSNYGDYYETDKTNNFDVYLLEKTLSVDTAGNLVGTGTFIYIEFNVPLTQDAMQPGTFTVANSISDVNCFLPGEVYNNKIYRTKIVTIDKDSITISLVKDGHYTFTAKGNNVYLIEGDLITQANEVVHFSYQGIINVADKREVPVQLHPEFTKGRLYYYGDAYSSKISNNFVAYLATKDVNFADSVLNGEMLMLEINTPLTVTDSIPNGTYNMIPKLTEAADLIPTSLVIGYTESESGDKWGCWYYGKTSKKLKTGNIVVSRSGINYTINYELYDRVGSKISGTFTGPLQYINGTVANSVQAAKVKRFAGIKSFDNIKPKEKKYKSDFIKFGRK